MNTYYDVIIIGGGPAGMVAALKTYSSGLKTLIIERDNQLGGILNQCIHDGFGINYTGENLTGPEFVQNLMNKIENTNIDILYNSFVINMTANKEITVVTNKGVKTLQAKSIILCMGCRERTRDSIKIPGARIAGIYTAGMAQRYINIDNYKPGSKFVILGSGDIGLIMARRLVLEGMDVVGVYELMKQPNGLQRNIQNCLNDFGTPLHLSTTITRIIGKNRVEAVEIAKVDDYLNPISETKEIVPCDTLLLAVGLIPENELTYKAGATIDPITKGPVVDDCLQTSISGIFACGNVLHVHDLVDNVALEAEHAAISAVHYVIQDDIENKSNDITLSFGNEIRYVLPSKIVSKNQDVKASFRVKSDIKNGIVKLYVDNTCVKVYKNKTFRPSIMEQIIIQKELINSENIKNIEIVIENGR